MLAAEKFLIFTDTDGNQHTVKFDAPVVQFNKVKIGGDSKKCATRHAADGPVVYEWSESTAADNPNEIPDGVFRTIAAEFSPGTGGKTFCSAQCLSDYLKYEYVMPLSPREIEEQRKRNEAVEAAKAVQQMDASAQAELHDEERTLN